MKVTATIIKSLLGVDRVGMRYCYLNADWTAVKRRFHKLANKDCANEGTTQWSSLLLKQYFHFQESGASSTAFKDVLEESKMQGRSSSERQRTEVDWLCRGGEPGQGNKGIME